MGQVKLFHAAVMFLTFYVSAFVLFVVFFLSFYFLLFCVGGGVVRVDFAIFICIVFQGRERG